jgi:putative ABC transport system permease protein
MRAIFRQVEANLKSRRLQSALILLTLLAATTLLTLALLTFHTASGAYNRLFERSHGAHVWVYLDPWQVTGEQSERQLADLPGVEATTGVIRSLSSRLKVGGESTLGQELREWPAETIAVARPLLVAGRVPERGERDAIVLDRNVAAYAGGYRGEVAPSPRRTGRRDGILRGAGDKLSVSG